MTWIVDLHPDFEPEFNALKKKVKLELLARITLLESFGPELKRPYADTLNGSRYPNMKELRFDAEDGVWRVAYAFDPSRQAIILVAGDKSGVSQQKFYKALIKKADQRFAAHLKTGR